jgi:hypothetical protein
VTRLGENFALVTYTIHVTAEGSTGKALRSSVWQYEAEGKWRTLFHQGTKSQ